MRKFLFTAICFYLVCNSAMASAVPSGSVHHHDYPNLRVIEFLQLSVKDLEKLTGEKMNLGARISFGILKARMKRALKKDPALTVNDFMTSQKKMKTWLLVVLIVLGAFLLAFLIFAAAYGGAFN